MKWSALPVMVLSAATVLAQGRGGKGQGAIVIRDEAPVYVSSKGPAVEWKMKRGDAVAGYMANGILPPRFLLDEVDGRVHVAYFRGEVKGMNKTGWMDPKDLSRFTYDGSCAGNASPFDTKGFSLRWNACFQEGRDNKLDLLRPLWAQEDQTKARTPIETPEASSGATPLPAAEKSGTPTPPVGKKE